MIAVRYQHYLLRIVANHGQRSDSLPVEAEVLGEGLRQSNAVPVSHEPPDRPRVMLRVPRSEALDHQRMYERITSEEQSHGGAHAWCRAVLANTAT